MTKTTRRFLFYGFFIIFMPLSIAIVLYSTGWRLNAEACSDIQLLNCLGVRKTGAIYIETKPKSVKIEINGEIFADQTGLIQSGTLISNLLPKIYEVKIEKNGYFSYYKNVTVQPSLVAELIDTILIPQKINEEIVIESKLKGDKISAFDDNSEKLIVKNSKTETYYLYDLKDLSASLNINVLLNNAQKNAVISKISFHPFDSNRLIIGGENGLYILDTSRLKLETITDKTIFWLAKNSTVYYLKEIIDEKSPKTKNYSLNSFNLILKTESEILKPQIQTNFIKFDISDSGDRFALLDSFDNLYIFSSNAKEPKQIAHNAKDFLFSPDSKKIAFFDQNGQLNIYFLEDWYKNSRRIAGDVSRFAYAEKISEVFDIYWHKTSYHLIVGYENNIEFTEIDDRPPLNKYKLIEADDFYYSSASSKIYFIQGEKLYSFEL